MTTRKWTKAQRKALSISMRRVRRRKDALLLKPVGKGASIPLNAIPKRNPKHKKKLGLGAEHRLRMKMVRQLSQMINELLTED